MSDVQARPNELSSFYTTETAAANNLETDRDTLDNAFIAFRNAPGGGCAAQGDAVVGQAMTALIAELREIPDWVKLVHDAVLAADHTSDNGLVSVSTVAVNTALQRIAADRNINITDLATSSQLTVTPPQVGTVPQDSGYVDDPVCTSTGHLLVDSRDFAMPARLDVLTFRRTYASRAMRPSAFGPGWWSWTEARALIDSSGRFAYVGPDALQLTLDAGGEERLLHVPDLDLTVELVDAATQLLRWGRRSRNPNQHWTFRDGLLVEVSGPFVGTTSLTYSSRRLTMLAHDSGRTLVLRWKRNRVVEIVSSDGRRAGFAYNHAGALIAVDNATSPETYQVDDAGRILSITDADGVRTVAMVYDTDGRVVEQTSATGFTTRFDYDPVRRTTLSDPDYNPLSVYTHDEHGRVEMYATGGGFRFSRRFDGLGRVVSQRDPDGRSFTLIDSATDGLRGEEVRWSSGDVERYDYDWLGRLVRQESNTATTRFAYDGESLLPARIEAVGDQGLAIELEWRFGTPSRIVDSDGVVDVIDVRPDGTIAAATNGVGATTSYEVDPSGAVVAVQHPDGRVVRYERDHAGRVLAVVNAAGRRGEIRYSAAGRLVACIDADGATTSVDYDAAGLPSRIVAADGTATSLLFDDKQRIIGAHFANGDRIGLELDEFGREIAVDINDDRWVTARDPAGRIVERVDPTGERLAQEYGDLGGWMQIADAAGQSWRMERDIVDRVRTLTTPAGDRLTATFKPEGLLATQTMPDGGEQTYVYTSAGRLAEVADGSTITRYRYDAGGRIVGLNAGSGWWTFDLDVAGRIVRRVSPAGREQRYGYDVLGHLASLEAGHETWRFEYDDAGRLIRSVDPTGCEARFRYDVVGRLVESADSLGTAVRYGYDVRGRIAAMIDAHGGAIRYEHNAVNKLTSVTDQLGRQTTVTYDAAGRHLATTYLDPRAEGVAAPSAAFALDAEPALVLGGDARSWARTTSADGTLTTWTLPGGARVELVRDADLLPHRLSGPDFVRTWTHDACGRVIEVIDRCGNTTSTTSFRRDAAGRVLEQRLDGIVTTYAYDRGGQLTSMTDRHGTSSWEYDEVGRLVVERTPAGERRFRYDAAHQLVELVDSDGTTSFDYDARGRRLRARGAVDIDYVWNDRRLEAIVVDGTLHRFTIDEKGSLRRAGDLTIGWDDTPDTPRPTSINDEPVITVDAGTFGTIGADGSVRWRPFELADAWGESPDLADGWHPYFGVASEGIVWLRARPYDVATRQFLAPDPLAPVPGKPGSVSSYTYAANDPVNLFDPTGHQPISIEAFNDVRDRRTGVQWQNIASAAIAVAAVAVTVATLGTAGPVAMVLGGAAIGAVAGAASGAAREGIESGINLGDGEFNGGTIVRDAIVGGLGGAAGGGLGAGANALTASTRFASNGAVRFLGTRGGSMVTEGASGVADGVINETYDVTMPSSWGADGRWDNRSIVVNTVVSAGAGGALHNIGAPSHHGGADVPTSGGVDPNTVHAVDSPVPNVPEATPVSTSHPTNAGDTQATADAPHVDVPQADAPQSDVPHADAPHADVPQADAPHADAPQADAPQADVPQADAPQADAPQADAPHNDVPHADAPQADAPQADVPHADAPQADAPQADAPQADAPHNDVPQADAPQADAPQADAPHNDVPHADAPQADAPQADVPHADAPQADAPQADAPQADAPHNDVPQADAPQADAPQADVPQADAPQADAPQADVPHNDVPHVDAPHADAPEAHAPQADVPHNDVPHADAPHAEVPHADVPQADVPHADAPQADVPHADAPHADVPHADVPHADVPQADAPHADAPHADVPHADVPQTDVPHADVPHAPVHDAPPAPAADAPHAPAHDAPPGDTSSATDVPDGAEPVAASAAAAAAVHANADSVANLSPDGLVRTPRSFRSNRFEFVSDSDGVTRSVHGEINESASGLERSPEELRAQAAAADAGVPGDHGGHIVGHRFISDQGGINMFPQAGQFNLSGYKTLENELQAWAANGFSVEIDFDLYIPPGTVRPDSLTVDYVVTNPQTGEIAYWRAVEFQNQAGQTFTRVETPEIRAQHTAAHDLHVRPADDVPDGGD